MTSTILAILQSHPVFTDTSAEVKKHLAELARYKEYGPEENLAFAGDDWPYLFLVAEGSVNATKASSDGRSLVIAQIEKNDLFWGLSFFQDGLPNPVTLQFSQAGSVFLWEREQVLPLFLENGRMVWELSRLMVKRMMLASDVIEGLAFQPVAGRLARLLLAHFSKSDGQSVKRSLTLDEMAARVGSTREMVCRALYRFADHNLIEVTRTEFSLTDKDGLARLADMD